MPKGALFVEYSTKLYNVTASAKNCLQGRGDPENVLVVRIERRLREELEAWM
jgi:hypothetical protein